MRILITSDCYTPTVNGVVTSIVNLKFGLMENGHEVRILTLSSSAKNEIKGTDYYIASIKGDVIYPDIRIKILPCKKILEEIYAWKPDIIHSQSEFSTFAIAKKISKTLSVPIVHTYHTVYEDYTHYFSPSKTVGKKVVKEFTKKLCNYCDAIIAPTEKVQEILTEYGVFIPIEVVPSGINLLKFQKELKKEEIFATKKKLGIPCDYKVFVSVSRVSKEKSIDELIRYFKNSRIEKAVLVIVGGGPSLTDLISLVKSLDMENRVLFTGMIIPQNVPLYYRVADVFLSASTSETQGLTYIEALASGTPILCRKDDCLIDIVKQGENGFTYETEEEFLSYLHTICEDRSDIEEMNIFQATKKSVEKLSIPNFARSMEVIYMELVENKYDYGWKCSQIRTYFSVISLILCGLITFFGYRAGWFTSLEVLQALVATTGGLAPLLFIVLQIAQVVIPIIPGGLGCLAGVLLFGPVHGFLYNYIGICFGSLIVFAISKNFGQRVLNFLFSKQLINKYQNWTNEHGRFNKLFALAIFLPIAPDDFLCYLAGTTGMTWKYFTGTILAGKILSIAAYSFGLTVVWKQIITLLT